MQLTDDMNLLRDYAAHGSNAAFETLVRRHVNLVYSASLRRVGDPVLAGEVTQTVFIILAQKAPSLRSETILSGWLYRTAQLAAGHALRAAWRRRKHEEEAAQMQAQESKIADATWEQIAPVLEEAMEHLGEADRNVVLLRYFENKDFKSVGAALGVSDDTAQKRAARALEKLRVFLTKRGVLLPAITVAAALSTHAVQAAPVHVAAASIAAQGTAAVSQSSTLLKGTLKLMAWTKLKTIALIGVVALFAAATATFTVQELKPRPDLSWEVENPSDQSLLKAKPQLTILPTKFAPSVGWRGIWSPGGQSMGVRVSIAQMIGVENKAFEFLFNNRVIVATPLPEDTYDFICSYPQGASNTLRKAIANKFGVTGSIQMIETNAFVLSVRNPAAAGLKPTQEKRSGGTNKINHYFNASEPISELRDWLINRFKTPVINQTGLTGNYSIELDWNEPDPEHPNLEALQKALGDQLGLEMTKTNTAIEMLVIEKVK